MPQLLCGIILFLAAGSASAGINGKMTGRITDKATGEPLPGVNVIVEGTSYGAATGTEGRYFIVNLPAGEYAVSASIIGFKKITVSGLVIVADFTQELDFALEESVLEGEVITVTAERPLLRKDETAPVEVVTSDELKELPIRGYNQVLALQSGVVDYSGGLISIRGGRASETAYYVDGFSQQDPLSGVSSTAINNNAIDQVAVMTGGFSAEYGRVMSGIVNVITKSGTKDYQGSVEYLADGLSGDWVGTPSYGYKTVSGSFSGPVIKGNERILFYVSGERRVYDDRFPRSTAGGRLPGNGLAGWNYQGKLSVLFSSTLNVEAGVLGSVQKDQIYLHSYKFNLEHTPRRQDDNNSAYIRLTKTISSRTFFRIAANYFYTQRYTGDGKHFKDLPGYGTPVFGRQVDEESLFYLGDDSGTLTDEGALFNDYAHRESSYIGGKADFTSQINDHHQFESGFEMESHTLRLYHHISPRNVYEGNVRAYQDLDVYGYSIDGTEKTDDGLDGAKNPVTAGLYVQDKIEYDNLVVNAGLRFDYINPDTRGLASEREPLGSDSKFGEEDLVGAKTVSKISPRLGVSFPTSESSMFYANFGKFFQQPNLENLYVSYRYLAYKIPLGGYFFPFGNPNLKPEETTAYELGFAKLFGANLRTRISMYYKDVRNLTQVARVSGSQFFYDSYRNADFATLRGIDFSAKLRRSENMSGQISYSLSWAKGTGSTPLSQRNVAFTGGERPKLLSPLDFDQRHTLSAVLDYRLGSGEGPDFFKRKLLQNSGFSMIFSAGSGLPYTPSQVYNEVTLAAVTAQPAGPVNSHFGPWTWQMDVKATKNKKILGRDFKFYIWIMNLLDRNNVISVYSSTGSATATGWLVTGPGQEFISRFGESGKSKYEDKEKDPTNYNLPRLFRFGVILEF